jgi:hypothetical protein
MENQKDNEIRSKETREIDELLERSAQIKVRHQRTMEKVEELKQSADEFLDSPEAPRRKKIS